MEKTKCEIYLAINEDGDYEVGASEEEAMERLTGNIAGYCCKVVKLAVKVTAPVIEETIVDVPDTAGQTIVTAE